MDEKKLLDLSILTEEQFAIVKRGWDIHNTSSKLSHFGQIDKNSLKEINKAFNYLDMRSFKKGALFTAAAFATVGLIRKNNKKKDQPEQVTVVENEE